ncbi:cyclopropane-fatty-acyl-phospholipid synthase [Deinococcus metalli]|uniref:Cyclopropane-fatty-acyl-phospholipid synthase n=1 Tax=Deinococcus metalli TaxID=1141878 RepID=A0A7W8KIA2_9DEIO|nr:cyclopropane-fatty-acyl-phospholipid synthase family protein [Deinococcus metalli]MBB5378390.1 cyclopropane-fatty-acyl-phospholipid synthase [Deinococcus metalli]GHF59273.1 cyclopropane-fatty-acyl-phospholipid synthase [Deinococcus metalli]
MTSEPAPAARARAHRGAPRTLLVVAGVAAGVAARRALRPPPGEADRKAVTLDILNVLLPTRRTFDVRFWDGTVLPAAQQPARATLVLNHEYSLGRMLRFPLDVSVGEAYLRGDFDVEGDLGSVAALGDDLELTPTTLLRLLPLLPALRRAGAGAPEPVGITAKLDGPTHSRERDQQAVQYHYDVSNDFYRLWLDARMVYSCAYFPTGTETLDEAQTAKLEYLCRKLRLTPGERLLDIGCGWGGLAIYAAQHFGVRVLGVTLSGAQLHEGRARVKAAGVEDLVTLDLRDYRDVLGGSEGTFDKISSVGMAEHVGTKNLPTYFRTAYAALKPGGLMMNHAIGAPPHQRTLPQWVEGGNFAGKYVFPDGELQPIWQTLKVATEAGFEARDVENLREHYARTLRCWADNLDAHAEDARAVLGEQRFRLWRLYLNACVPAFQRGNLHLYQSLLAKPDAQQRAHVPLSRADLYR